MATRPHHGAKERHDEPSCESAGTQKYDEEAVRDCLYDSAEEDIKCLFKTGENDSTTRQRTPHPGYPKRETSAFQKRDWAPKSIVSSFANMQPTYTMPLCPFCHFLPFTQARCQLFTLTVLLLFFLLFTVIHYHCEESFFTHHNISTTFFPIRCQSTFYFNQPTRAFLHNIKKSKNRLLQVN